MEDVPGKEDNQPSASKKESQRIASTQDLYERRKYEERRDDHPSNSESFTSGSYSARSHVEVVEARPEVPKPPIAKREAKPTEKKKRIRRSGRVDKRRRTPTRRQAIRRQPRKKPRKDREPSASTIFTKLSSQSGTRSPGCKFCGHRCCRRRYEYEVGRRKYGRKAHRKYYKQKQLRKQQEIIKIPRVSKKIQVGSKCMMLSPLFINSNSTPDGVPEEKLSYCQVTPEMIYASLRKLSMWRQAVMTRTVMNYMVRHYPVNRNQRELLKELSEKLRVAVIVGIITCVGDERWCLNCALQNRTIEKTHVTRFWQVYADTMNPIRRAPRAAAPRTGSGRANKSKRWCYTY